MNFDDSVVPSQLREWKAYRNTGTPIPFDKLPPDVKDEAETWLRFLRDTHGQRMSAKMAAIERAKARGTKLTREQILTVLGYESWELPEHPSGEHTLSLSDIRSVQSKIFERLYTRTYTTVERTAQGDVIVREIKERLLPSLGSLLRGLFR